MDPAKGQPLFMALPVQAAPVQGHEPSMAQRPMSELLPAGLGEPAVALEPAAGESEERHPLITRIVALTGTTLSVAFVAWALHHGAVLAGIRASLSAGGSHCRDR